ncbi:MAG: hypothetical protein H6811_05110 [Phycisphaeraceae bacterium]|nr:hypothetical protein [Phycisphaeraceae bacterium]
MARTQIWIALVCGCVAAMPAMADRKGAWDGSAFLDPRIEPDTERSYIALQNGRMYDHELSSMLFTSADTKIESWFNMQFVFEACRSGGFIGDLATTTGKESDLGDAGKLRRDIGVMTATSWDRDSYFDPNYSYFPHGFTESVKAPHPGGDTMLDAFKAGSLEAKDNVGFTGADSQVPQYWSYDSRQDEDTLQVAATPRDIAFLVVNPANKNTEKEFWNDLVALHDVMINDYGWSDAKDSDDELIVLFADGTKPNFVVGDIPWIDGAASEARIATELARVRGRMTSQSLGFFYFGGHGNTCAIPAPGVTALLALGGVIGVGRRRRAASPR